MKKNNSILIVHFYPVELYPPALNIINHFETSFSAYNIRVITTKTSIINEFEKPYIIRIGCKENKKTFIGLFNFIWFNFITLLKLIYLHPSKILYVETHSAFPVFIYRLLINHHCKIYIHNHELTTKEDYKKGMKLIRFIHKFEKYLYAKSDWISQTHKTRLEIFKSENNIANNKILNVLPNYPPKEWYDKSKDQKVMASPLKIIYIGTFASFDTLYIKEFLEWVKLKEEVITLDIYSFFVPDNVKKYINSLNSKNIRLYGSISYFNLPEIIKNYHVGIILYKKSIPSVTYSISNKLFEYISLGLDVWFPEEIIGTYEMIEESKYPRIIKINFNHLNDFDLTGAISNRNDKKNYCAFNCNNEIQKLLKVIID